MQLRAEFAVSPAGSAQGGWQLWGSGVKGETQDRELEPRPGRGRLGSAGMDEMPTQGQKRKEQSAGQEGTGVRKSEQGAG